MFLFSCCTASYRISDVSTMQQTISLTSLSRVISFKTTVDWHESHRFLKVEFPVNIHNDQAKFETQYGYVKRNTHANTTHDLAKFESCAHRWCDLSEAGYGVAILNNCKYGYAVHQNIIRLSLLRSPKKPDEHCDMGLHEFSYGFYCHEGGVRRGRVTEVAAGKK